MLANCAGHPSPPHTEQNKATRKPARPVQPARQARAQWSRPAGRTPIETALRGLLLVGKPQAPPLQRSLHEYLPESERARTGPTNLLRPQAREKHNAKSACPRTETLVRAKVEL